MPEQIKILVVDDHSLFRQGVMRFLRDQDDFVLVGEASNGAEAIQLGSQYQPDVVLLDLYMPQRSGLEVLRDLKQSSDTRVLMLTVSNRDEDLLEAIKAGADGYLLKNVNPEELCRAIRQVTAGQSVLSPEVTATVMHAAAQAQNHHSRVSLSPRESEVLAELARGATTDEIASTLVISPSTVKTHISHILEKLDAANRAEAVSRAVAMGLLEPVL